jgi:hypothetical protein
MTCADGLDAEAAAVLQQACVLEPMNVQLNGALARAEGNLRKHAQSHRDDAPRNAATSQRGSDAHEQRPSCDKPREGGAKSSRLFGGAQKDAEAASKAYDKACEALQQGDCCACPYSRHMYFRYCV